jgi:hypothetical protein
MPTLLAAAGEPGIAASLRAGYRAGGRSYKVHLDGYDMTGMLSGTGPGERSTVFYFDDNGNFNALRGSSTCAPTPSKPRSIPASTRIFLPTSCGCSFRRRWKSASGWLLSETSRHGSPRPASASTR